MLEVIQEMAEALRRYEAQPTSAEASLMVDTANTNLGNLHSQNPAIEALILVVECAIDEDGFRFIPAARVLCSAIEGSL